MKFFSQSFQYDDPWSIVSLAYFLRYPNPYASHIISCDVVSREFTPSGSLLTTRLILKRGALPRWAKNIISRSESWVIEESEVDPVGRILQCRTRNLEFTKVMQMEEFVTLRQGHGGTTHQTIESRVISRFGWGLTKRIEAFGLNKAKSHVQRSREGVSLIVDLIRQSRLQPLAIGAAPISETTSQHHEVPPHNEGEKVSQTPAPGRWSRLKSWLYSRPQD